MTTSTNTRAQEFRDLQIWSQLPWFDEEFQATDPEVRDWIQRGRNFTLADQRRMGEKQREIIGMMEPAYRKLATSGQIDTNRWSAARAATPSDGLAAPRWLQAMPSRQADTSIAGCCARSVIP